MNNEDKKAVCYGTATVGSKGQIVIPAAARKVMQLVEGERVLIFGKGEELLAVVKASQLTTVVQQFTQALHELQEVLE